MMASNLPERTDALILLITVYSACVRLLNPKSKDKGVKSKE